jgi:hypothetical protein
MPWFFCIQEEAAMKRGESIRSKFQAAATVLAFVVFGALPASAQKAGPMKEARFLVRYEHGSANLPPWQGLTLYVNSESVRILAGSELVHDIRVTDIRSFTHELRAPFHPAKTMERVSNDTIGSCTNLPECVVLGPAGVVGMAGVGVATLFTPKENVITLQWTEAGQPRELAMKIAWYQRDFILRALEKATGLRASERTGAVPKQPHALPAPSRQNTQVPQAASIHDPATVVSAPAPQTAVPAAVNPQPAEQHDLIRRFDLVLDRTARVGTTQLVAGFYLVLVQERESGKAAVVFLDDSVKDSHASRIVARATADVIAAASEQALQPIFRDEAEVTRLFEIQLPGRTLRLIP